MCEANAYLIEGDRETLLLEAVNLVEPAADNQWRLVSIFGEQKLVKGEIKRTALMSHRIYFAPPADE